MSIKGENFLNSGRGVFLTTRDGGTAGQAANRIPEAYNV